ncbi:MAG TPA: DUF2145 domain-containing protein [Candidatus Didemnitutus sp.]|nr:DUF2145 domain-containing protein [Candidatus Didemnitutus sp.]
MRPIPESPSRHGPLLALVALAGASCLVGSTVHAGASADDRVGVEKFGADAIRDFALKVNDELDRRSVNVGILARTGRPRSELPRGVRYTHVAFVVFEAVRGTDGSIFHTYTTYNLYQRPPDHDDRSFLKQDFTYDFIAGVAEPDVAVCVPDVKLQRRILAVIRSPTYRALYHPEYNLFANPWVDRYDNCVTHVLKICVAAIYQTNDPVRIDADIRDYFQPTRIRLGLLRSVGAGFMKSIRTDDEDASGFQTATYDSLNTFLEKNGLARESFVIAMDLRRDSQVALPQ